MHHSSLFISNCGMLTFNIQTLIVVKRLISHCVRERNHRFRQKNRENLLKFTKVKFVKILQFLLSKSWFLSWTYWRLCRLIFTGDVKSCVHMPPSHQFNVGKYLVKLALGWHMLTRFNITRKYESMKPPISPRNYP
jgi:hypothetical protein